MHICARPFCNKGGLNRCSICLRQPYCSGECQKIDWKSHKIICKTYLEALRVIDEVYKERPTQINLDAIVLTHLVSFEEHQYGDRVPGKAYRERARTDRSNGLIIFVWK